MKLRILTVLCILLWGSLKADYLEYRIRVMGITNALIKVNHIRTDTLGIFDVHVETMAAVSIFSNVDNYYYSTYKDGFSTNYYKKKIEQSNYKELREVFLNPKDNIAFFKDYLKDYEDEFPIFNDTCDLFCGLFRMTKDAEIGGTFHIFSNKHLWKVNYQPSGLEEIKTELGTFSAYKISVYFTQITEGDFKCTDIFTNNILKENQLLELWISADNNRIPLQAVLHRKNFKVYWDILQFITSNEKN